MSNQFSRHISWGAISLILWGAMLGCRNSASTSSGLPSLEEKASGLDHRIERTDGFRTHKPMLNELLNLEGYWPNQSTDRFRNSIGPLAVTQTSRADEVEVVLSDSISKKKWQFYCPKNRECAKLIYNNLEVQPEHFSRSPIEPIVSLLSRNQTNRLELQYFSLQIGSSDSHGGSLEQKREKPTRDPSWFKSEVMITLCGAPNEVRELAELVLSDWQRILRDRLALRLRSSENQNCPPFSDLETHGLYWVSENSYVGQKAAAPQVRKPAQAQNRGANWVEAGLTKTIWYPRNRRLVDGDIFLFADQVEKFGAPDSPERRRSLRHLIAHEIGHFLGLDHASPTGPPAVMVPGGPDRPQAADAQALSRIYGE